MVGMVMVGMVFGWHGIVIVTVTLLVYIWSDHVYFSVSLFVSQFVS